MRFFFSERSTTRRANWFQRQRAAALVSAIAISALTFFFIQEQWKKFFWTPLQREYWHQYCKAAWPTSIDDKGSQYHFLELKRSENQKAAKDKTRAALNPDVVLEDGKLKISQETAAEGWLPYMQAIQMRDEVAYEWFRKNVYEGKPWMDVIMPPWYFGGVLWALSIVGFMFWDYSDQRKTEQKRVTSDTETQLVTPQEMSKKIKGDGLGIPYFAEQSRLTRLLRIKPPIYKVRVRLRDETEHFMVVADTRQGKSVLFHWWLDELASRRDRVIIYDPALEFWKSHGNKKRGDILLHPLYIDMPFWDLAAEIRTEEDAAQMANSFLPPEKESRPDFWDGAGQRLLTFLLVQMKSQGKGIPDLLNWLANPDKIDEMIEAYEPTLKPFVDRNATAQRSGVLSSLNKIANSLKLLPGLVEEVEHSKGVEVVNRTLKRERFSFRDWAERNSRGWVFIGCRFPEREVLRPLVSAWLDTMFGVLMERTGGPSTFLFLDELPTLQKLPKLKGALQEAGKYNVKFVIAFQGRAQLEELYGREAETLMSAPGTRIFLKTKEFSAAEWAAKNIGMPEQERETDSVTAHTSGRDSENRNLERKVDYIVRTNQIQNLDKLTGYLRYDRYVCPIKFEPLPLPERNNFEERKQALITPNPKLSLSEEAPQPNNKPQKPKANELKRSIKSPPKRGSQRGF